MSVDAAHADAGLSPAELAIRALFAVLHGAAVGELPAFAWTLDLPQRQLLALITEHLPEALTVIPLSGQRYASLRQQVPREFHDLLDLMLASRAPTVPLAAAERSARVIAAACFGRRYLWRDLGLRGREDVALLFSTYFPALYRANARNQIWKRFLFAEISARRGSAPLHPPNCVRCEDFTNCFPAHPDDVPAGLPGGIEKT